MSTETLWNLLEILFCDNFNLFFVEIIVVQIIGKDLFRRHLRAVHLHDHVPRSEERRVGKECM